MGDKTTARVINSDPRKLVHRPTCFACLSVLSLMASVLIYKAWPEYNQRNDLFADILDSRLIKQLAVWAPAWRQDEKDYFLNIADCDRRKKRLAARKFNSHFEKRFFS